MSADDDRTLAAPDPERTILIPRPGGLRAGGRPASPAAPPVAALAASGARPVRAPITKPVGLELQRLVAGLNPLLGAANLLLALVPRLRATAQHDDPPALHRQLLVRVHEFETAARQAGVPRPRLSAARYVLCAFLDEVIAGTPWGVASWDDHTLIGALHEERWGGEKAFQLLERIEQDVDGHRDVLELFYVCLALGFEGRWRGRPDGAAALLSLRTRLHDQLRPDVRGLVEQGVRRLSLQWQPAELPSRSRWTAVPLWLAPVAAAALGLGLVLALQWRSDGDVAPVLAGLHQAAARLRVPLPAAAAQTRLATVLPAPLAASGVLQEDARQSRVVLPAEGLFAAGTARLADGQPERLVPLAQALAAQPGQIVVSGHTDGERHASLQFPSNWELSRAWAEAVAQALVAAGLPPDRVRAEARADTEAPAAGQPARRIEITLRLPRPAS